MRTEYSGSILEIRAVEDCIRATKKYTKGAFSKSVSHPIQGEDFPSKVLTEYYEVYPDLELNWDMPAIDAWAWVWGETSHIDIKFHYNYAINKGELIIYGNSGVVNMLKEGIPNFTKTLANLRTNLKKEGNNNAVRQASTASQHNS